jgi:CheY-like chemotaxis protein
MDRPTDIAGRLVLLVDPDPATRLIVRPLLIRYGLELVQARTTVAALELLQRMPDRFRMAVVCLEMPVLSGSLLIETLRLFRPALPVVCLKAGERSAVGAGTGNCLAKPVRADELRAQLEDALAGESSVSPAATVTPAALARAQAEFAVSGNLLEAARELARGMPGETASGW